MRRKNTAQLLAALLAALTLLVSGCGEKQEASDGAPDEPLMREEDLTVEPQPDANFTLELPDGFLSLGADYEPNGKTENTTYDSDGMLPYDFARHYDADAQLVVGTDYYPETGREVISYLRTDAMGAGTPRGVKVGDSEKALLTEYPEALYCIAADESELYDGYSDEGGYSEPAYDFDRAYVWQPQTPQDDGNYDVRDIAFYLKDGTVSAITMTKPYAFRFAVGLADARAVDAQRAAATDDDRAEACEAGDVGCAAVGPAVAAHFKQQDTAGDVGGDVGNVAVLRGQVRAVVALAVPDDEPRAVVEDCAAAGHVGDGNAAVAVL